jgi:methylated-DNA-[protein]-cysteine S-methyltransferase
MGWTAAAGAVGTLLFILPRSIRRRGKGTPAGGPESGDNGAMERPFAMPPDFVADDPFVSADLPGVPAAIAAFESPIGPVFAAATPAGVIGLEVLSTAEVFASALRRRTGRALVQDGEDAGPEARAHLSAAREAVTRFLSGGGAEGLAAVPVALEGCSAWDRRVLGGVRRLAPGEVAGYGQLARRIGAPGAARAAGGAVGRNPVGLLVPCHRVIAGDGTLGGYGGAWPGDREALLALKERLLALEGVRVPRRPG